MTRDAFHQEVREIEESVIRMASLVEDAIANAMQAVARRDLNLARQVIAQDTEVNDLQRQVRNRCLGVMARQAPVARDLRELLTVQLVVSELERMGDHAVDIGKQVVRLAEAESLPMVADLIELSKQVRAQVRAGIQAFVDVNMQAARDVCAGDDQIDHGYRIVFTALLEVMTAQPVTVPAATSLLFIAHDLERIGDRVTNICEDVIYMVSGEIEELN